MPGPARAHNGLPGVRGAGPGGRKAFARRAIRHGMARRTLAVEMSGAVRGQIAFVHALHAVFARSPAVDVDTLCLALAAAHTSAAGPEGSRAHHACFRHGGAFASCCGGGRGFFFLLWSGLIGWLGCGWVAY